MNLIVNEFYTRLALAAGQAFPRRPRLQRGRPIEQGNRYFATTIAAAWARGTVFRVLFLSAKREYATQAAHGGHGRGLGILGQPGGRLAPRANVGRQGRQQSSGGARHER